MDNITVAAASATATSWIMDAEVYFVTGAAAVTIVVGLINIYGKIRDMKK